MLSNLPYGVFRFPRIKRGQAPDWSQAERVCTRLTPSEAMDAANECKRNDPAHTYCVADAAALN